MYRTKVYQLILNYFIVKDDSTEPKCNIFFNIDVPDLFFT